MHQVYLYYSMQDGMDGTAYPSLFESRALCDIDQNYQEDGREGMGSGYFVVESDAPITITSEVITAEYVLQEIEEFREDAELDEELQLLDEKRVAIQKYISERDNT